MGFAVRNFDHAETLGEKLRTMRRNQNFSLRTMAEKTKIQLPYLSAFERNAWGELPEPMYAKNFLRTYVRSLGGDPSYFLERFDRERGTCDLVDPMRLPRQKVRAVQFFSAHRLLKAGACAVLFVALATYAGFQIQTLLQPPELVVFEPSDEYATDNAIVHVRGKTEEETEVFVNGNKILPSAGGEFEGTVTLERGLNVITIESENRHARKTTVYRRVVLEQPSPRGVSSLSTTLVREEYPQAF